MADSNSARAKARNAGARSKAPPVEERMEQWGRRIGRVLARAGARAREEAEDIWAEAQSLRERRGR